MPHYRGALNRYAPRLLSNLGDAWTSSFKSAEPCLSKLYTRLSNDDAARCIRGPSESSPYDGVVRTQSQIRSNVQYESTDQCTSMHSPPSWRLPALSTWTAESRQLVAGVGRHPWWRGYFTTPSVIRTERQRTHLEKLVIPSALDDMQTFFTVSCTVPNVRCHGAHMGVVRQFYWQWNRNGAEHR